MLQIDVTSRKSIYEQVMDMVKEMIINGVLEADEKIPSVRELSKELTVNPNTIQKAYRELERQGFIYTVSGRGCFVVSRENVAIDEKQKEELMDRLLSLLRELRLLGVSQEEIKRKIEEVYNYTLQPSP